MNIAHQKHAPLWLLLLTMVLGLFLLTACSSDADSPQAGEEASNDVVADSGANNGLSGAELDSLALEAALSQAILERDAEGRHEGNFVCESHVTLATEVGGTADSNEVDTVTVYALVLYEEYDVTQAGISTVSGSHIPTALTFTVDKNNKYMLQEYWIPGDGSAYAADIAAKFPEAIREDAMDTQKYILSQTQNCYAQAVQFGKVDTAAVIQNLLAEIMSAPADSANPNDYIEAHPVEYRELTYYGDYTLRYVLAEFLKGGQTGLQGQIMRSVMVDLLGTEAIMMDDSNGQEYFEAWKESVQKTAAEKGSDYVRHNLPKGYILLQMLDQE